MKEKENIVTPDKSPVKMEVQETEDVSAKSQENEINNEEKEEKKAPEKKFETDEKEKALWMQISSKMLWHLFFFFFCLSWPIDASYHTFILLALTK